MLLLQGVQTVRVDVQFLQVTHQLLVVLLESSDVKGALGPLRFVLFRTFLGGRGSLSEVLLHGLVGCFESSVLQLQVLPNQLNKPAHLRLVLEVHVVDLDVFHCVALGLVRIGLVHKALLQLVIGALRVLRWPMRLMKLI